MFTGTVSLLMRSAGHGTASLKARHSVMLSKIDCCRTEDSSLIPEYYSSDLVNGRRVDFRNSRIIVPKV
jgi:hypothetical protein